MYLSIIVLPLFSFILCAGFGLLIGHLGAAVISCSFVAVCCLLSYIAFYKVAICGVNKYIYLSTWIDSGLFQCGWSFNFDTLTVVMLVVVTTISSLVHLYSTEYMAHDPHLPRFMSYLSLFTFFMLILVTGDNFMVIFVGWEGVGLCSYLLINFWFTRLQANKAAIKAMVMNRIGDFGLSLGIFTMFYAFRALDYDVVFSLVHLFEGETFNFIYRETSIINAICVFLFIGAIGKSAQLGLHTWLPDAMEGPTPVSALIHAATMVTAGVFLLVRCSPLYEYSSSARDLITIVGAATALFAATVGLLQNDMKKVIAYSTCSQLGYMVFSCGLSNYAGAMFHLSNHAFFKALLFLGAGSVIHAMDDEQDMRRMGGLKALLPYTYAMFLIGNLALTGFPYLSGFYSKDLILESAYAKYTFSGHFSYWLGTIAAFFTGFYSIRLMYLVFLSEPNGYKKIMENVHESPIRMLIPLAILSIFSIFVGYYTKDMFVGFGTDFWGHSIFVHPYNLVLIDSEFIPFSMKLNPLIFSITGAISSFYLYDILFEYLYIIKTSEKGRKIYLFLNKKWFFDKLIQEYITQKSMHIAYDNTYRIMDKGFFELFGPNGLTEHFYFYSKNSIKLYTGFLYDYTFITLIGITFFTLIIYFYSWFINILDLKIVILIVLTLIFNYSKKYKDIL